MAVNSLKLDFSTFSTVWRRAENRRARKCRSGVRAGRTVGQSGTKKLSGCPTCPTLVVFCRIAWRGFQNTLPYLVGTWTAD
jgi:hypothetical protein